MGLWSAVIAFAVGFSVAMYSVPDKVVTKTQTQFVERAVVETQQQKNKTYIITERKRPDGTVTKRTEIKDKSQIVSESQKDTHAASITETVTTNHRDDWKLRALSAVKSREVVYGAGLEWRLLGPLWVGGWGLTDKTIGLSFGLSF